MPKQTGAIVLILGGVGLIYLAATGYLESAWIGLRGGYINGGSQIPVDSGANGTGVTQQGGDGYTGARSLGRGIGGQVSNLPYVDKGVYYPGASGGLMASDAGVW
jgi:hypothetical protein